MSTDLSLTDFTLGAVVAGLVASLVMILVRKFAGTINSFVKKKLGKMSETFSFSYSDEFETLLKIKMLEVYRQKVNIYLIILGIMLFLISNPIVRIAENYGISSSVSIIILGFICGAGFGTVLAFAEVHQLALRKLLLEFLVNKLKNNIDAEQNNNAN